MSEYIPRNLPDEKRLCMALVRGLNRLDVQFHWIVQGFTKEGELLQAQMFEMCLGFLHHYSGRFREGSIREGTPMYRVGLMADRMISALDTVPMNSHVGSRGRTGRGRLP